MPEDPIQHIVLDIEWDDDDEQTYSYLYCGVCGENVRSNINGDDIRSLYLAARQHVADDHS